MHKNQVDINKNILYFFRLFLSLFLLILIPLYWHYYGFQNFLWLSDIGLFLTVISLWTNSSLYISMAMVGIFFLEFVWNVDFFVDLLFSYNLIDLSDYMFDPQYPLFLRGVSLFHAATPLIWLWYLTVFGYEKRALTNMTILYWLTLCAVYFFTDPVENINWVFLPHIYHLAIAPWLWVLFLFFAFPFFIFLPTHLICLKIFKRAS